MPTCFTGDFPLFLSLFFIFYLVPPCLPLKKPETFTNFKQKDYLAMLRKLWFIAFFSWYSRHYSVIIKCCWWTLEWYPTIRPLLLVMLVCLSVVSDSPWPYWLQHARLPYLPPSPGACSNSCPVSQWCHPTISSFVIPFSSCLQSFPTLGSFVISWLSHKVAKVLELQPQHQSPNEY